MKRIISAIKEKIQGKPLSLRSPKWDSVRDSFIVKHNTCASCGNTNIKKLQVHHIEPFHLYPEKELDPNNLITLCEEKGEAGCHLKLGHLGDWKSFNPKIKQDAEFNLKSLLTKIK
jgi:5-methylcytosine-specific restriction endonuclease McrA